jgi:hypothetical protein
MRTRSVGAVAIVAALAATILAVVLTRGAGAGPFAWPKDAGSSWHSFPLNPGQVGVVSVWLAPIDRPAVLLDVRPADAHDARGLALRYAASMRRGSPDGATGIWKPTAWQLRPVAGVTIPAHTRGHVMIAATAKSPGHYFVHAFIVDYKIGGTR